MSDAVDEEHDSHWHLDKKVPITLLVVLLLQFGGTMLYIGSAKSQGDENTRRIGVLESQKVSERLSSLEAKIDRLGSMESKIDRLVERSAVNAASTNRPPR